MIPIVFILGYMRASRQRELFVQNFIFTKKLALQAAEDFSSGELSEQQALDSVEKKTKELLDKLEPTLYSEAIQQAQLAEIRLLMQHYLSLFKSSGTSFADRIRSVYPSRQDYLAFIQKLRQAEKDVASAAVETVGDRADRDMVARIDDHTNRLRIKEADRLYPKTGQSPPLRAG
jgi:hypothetical protein